MVSSHRINSQLEFNVSSRKKSLEQAREMQYFKKWIQSYVLSLRDVCFKELYVLVIEFQELNMVTNNQIQKFSFRLNDRR